MSLLEDLYRGKIVPSEKSIKNGSEYQKLNEQLAEYLSEFSPLLDDKQREIFNQMQNTKNVGASIRRPF